MNIPAWTFGLAGGATGIGVKRPAVRVGSYLLVGAATRIANEETWVKNTAAFVAADALMAIISQLMFGTDVGVGNGGLPGNGTGNGTGELPDNGTTEKDSIMAFLLTDLDKVYVLKIGASEGRDYLNVSKEELIKRFKENGDMVDVLAFSRDQREDFVKEIADSELLIDIVVDQANATNDLLFYMQDVKKDTERAFGWVTI